MRILVCLFLLLHGSVALAACVRPGAAPAIPDGATADDAAMKAAHDAVQAYVNSLEAYQVCLKAQVEQAVGMPAELKATWIAQGDAAIDVANIAANQFSLALRTFKARSTTPTK
jgi:hypothetical protein